MKMFKILRTFIFSLFFITVIFCTNISYAAMASEEETMQLIYGSERMVSIATGSEQLLYKAPAIASVISRQDIELSSASSLNELLEMVPGLHISEDYFSGNAVYSMRGFFRDPDAGMLFLINGAPVNTLQNGSRLSAMRLPLNNIDQIEIIRGPGSAVYGADAFVGVINIITRKYENRQEYGIELGSFSNQAAWLQNNFKLGEVKTHLSLQYQSSKGDKAREVKRDMQSYFDDVTGTQASLAPDTMNTQYSVLDLELNLAYANWNFNQWLWMNNGQANGHGVPSLDTLDQDGALDSRASLSSIEYYNDELTEKWSLKFRLSYLNYVNNRLQNLLPSGSNAPIGSDGNLFTGDTRSVVFPSGMVNQTDTSEEQSQFELTGFYYGWNSHSVRLSSGYQLQKITTDEARNYGPGVLDEDQSIAANQVTVISDSSDVSFVNGERKLFYFTVQDEWDFISDWTLTAGVRYDNYSDFGSTTNPRLALVWQTRYDLSTKLLYGRAFRAPSYKELRVQNQLGFNGNSALAPETIDTLELAFDYRPTDKLTSRFGAFVQRAKNMIVAVEDTTIANSYTYENAETQEGYGVELEANWQISPRFILKGNYAWQFNELVESGVQAPYAPTQQLYTSATWKVGNFWSLVPELHYIGQRPRALAETRQPLAPSTRLDVMLKYKNHYENWDMSLRLRNLLNSDLYEPSIGNQSITGGAALANDIPLEGLRLMFEFRYFSGK